MEYRILDNPISSENPNSNAILEWVHSVLGNLVWTYTIKETYIDKDDLWLVILSAALFAV